VDTFDVFSAERIQVDFKACSAGSSSTVEILTWNLLNTKQVDVLTAPQHNLSFIEIFRNFIRQTFLDQEINAT